MEKVNREEIIEIMEFLDTKDYRIVELAVLLYGRVGTDSLVNLTDGNLALIKNKISKVDTLFNEELIDLVDSLEYKEGE